MGVVVDTSVLIAIERRGGDLGDLVTLAGRERALVATITISELLVGAYRSDHAHRRARREAFVEELLQIALLTPFDERVARSHARMIAALMRQGHLIGAHDMLIAATALSHGVDVLTFNTRDFERIPGLTIRLPSW